MASTEPRVLPTATDACALEELLVRTASGDELAFRSLYERTAGRLFAVCLRIARHRRIAENLLWEIYMRIRQCAHEFEPVAGSGLTWMIAIARKHALDVIQLQMREDRPPDKLTLEAANASACAAIEAKFELSAFGRCLRELNNIERHAIILAYRDGLNYNQLAMLLGVSAESVKTSVVRGLARLHNCIEPP
jgi:RNA polymerase sigma-70 factor, ECF subfamily